MPTVACGDGRQWWETAVSSVGVPCRFTFLNPTVIYLLQVFWFHHVFLIFAMVLLGDTGGLDGMGWDGMRGGN